MATIRLPGEMKPYYGPEDCDLFTLKIFHGGQMVVRDGSIRYVGGGIEYIDNLHRDYLSMFDLDKFGELVGYPAEVDIDYYYRAQTGRVGNYYPVDTDEDVVSMTQHLDKDRQCVLYIVRSKVQRYIRATARRTLLLNKSKALVILSEDESEPPQYVGGGQHGDYEYDNSSESEGQESNFVPRARQYHFGEGSGVKKRHAKRHGKKPVGEEEVGDAEGSCSGLVRAGVNHKSVNDKGNTKFGIAYGLRSRKGCSFKCPSSGKGKGKGLC